MAEERKLVSVLFADIVGSTALGHGNDPEVVRAVLGRYFDRAREIVELHGGVVEKYIGDAVMAVFGVPRVHDDDAERAVRAALAIRDAIAPLNAEQALELEARIGVNSGEVVASVERSEQRLVTGDVINVAARLQQVAQPGEVVVGALTEQLTREAIEYEPLAALELRGRPEATESFRAVRARSEVPEQARGLPQMRARLVGRTRELTLLADTFERARIDRRGQLFTVVGNAGVGKSRLVGEFLARTSGNDVRVLRGRCLPYGSGITYWPLIELVQSDLGITGEMNKAAVFSRLQSRLAILGNSPARAAAYARLSVLLGLTDPAQVLPDVDADRLAAELGWAMGEYARAVAGESALICVIDDLQWAEPAATAIVTEMLEATADSPLLMLCVARPELLERYPEWGAGRANSTTIVLEPLTDDETRTLISRLLDVDDMPERLRATIVTRSGGNPLFCEEFVRMLIDEGRIVRDGDRWRGATASSFEVRVPESIQALLAARLDGLAPDHKTLVQTASVIGEQFDGDQLGRLTSRDVSGDLPALTRAGFVLSDRANGPRAYRFKHLLVRDVAYASLPKAERARLHEAFGQQLEAAAGDRRDGVIEILAHHAERTLTLSLELRQSGSVLEARAMRAIDLVLEAGQRAIERGDVQNLTRFIAMGQAALAAAGEQGASRAPDLVLLEARAESANGNFTIAREKLERAVAITHAAGRQDLEARAQLALGEVLVFAQGEEDVPATDAAIEAADRLFIALGDNTGHLEAQITALEKLFEIGRMREMLDRGSALIDEAIAMGERPIAARLLARLIAAPIWIGETVLAEQMADRADAMTAELGLLAAGRMSRFFRARLHWVRGEYQIAENELRRLILDNEAAHDGRYDIATARLLGEDLIRLNRLDEAEVYVDLALRRSLESGDRWSRTELLSIKAWLTASRGSMDEADSLLLEARESLRESDYAATGQYNSILGYVRTIEGRYEEAEAAFRRAIQAVDITDNWSWQMNALDLADFLISRGRRDEAVPLIERVAEAVEGTQLNIVRRQLEQVRAALERQPAARGNL